MDKRFVVQRDGLYLVRESIWSERLKDAHFFGGSGIVAREISMVIIGSRVLPVNVPFGNEYAGEPSIVESPDYVCHIAGGRR